MKVSVLLSDLAAQDPIGGAVRRAVGPRVEVLLGTASVSLFRPGAGWTHLCASDLAPLPDQLGDGRVVVMDVDPLFSALRRLDAGLSIEPFTFDLPEDR